MKYFRQKQFALTADRLQEMTKYIRLAYPYRYVSRAALMLPMKSTELGYREQSRCYPEESGKRRL